MNILVINAGSSSLKYQLINTKHHDVLAKGICERIGMEHSRIKHTANNKETVLESKMDNHADAISLIKDILVSKDTGVIKSLEEISAVGHRVVHGGEAFNTSVIIDDKVMKTLEECIELAPLHNPPNITGIEACKEVMPNISMVAVFDTAFHQTMPRHAYLYALPYELYEKYKIRKYGFHGTSHRYVAERAAKLLNKPLNELKLITLHLGNGSSITAVKNGESVDTSMGLTPLAGVMMGTRSGLIDPAIVTLLMEKENLTIHEVNDLMNKNSGVLGISGVSSDFRDLVEAKEKGNERATLALEMFCYSVKGYIGRYAGIMGGLDAIVFTAGIGENVYSVRSGIVEGLEFLGIDVDEEKNLIRGEEIDISKPNAKVRTLVIPTNEELMIALETERLTEKD